MNTFIFDLDGTLLPMDQDTFLEAYFNALAQKMIPYKMEPKRLIQAVWAGIEAMIKNDGSRTNSLRFWETFLGMEGEKARMLEPVFLDFYQNEFHSVKAATETNPIASKCIKLLKEKGYSLILATNPVFPRIATLNRIQWAGLDPKDFLWITTYENSSFCKPKLEYYHEILDNLRLTPEECIMVGNDIREDMVVTKLGIETYLLTDCLINRKNEDISIYRNGNFEEFYGYIRKLPKLENVNR